ncbi:27628_t:CDS:2, partial [Gigaspora margarita]
QQYGLVQTKRSTSPTPQTGKLNQELGARRRERNSMTIRQVVKKRKREVLVEHWQDKNVILKRGKMEQEDIQKVYPKIQNIANQKVLPVPKEVIAKKKTRNIEALAPNLLDPQLIVEASLARHLVKSQVSNKVLSLDLLEVLEQNILNRKEVYKFYTDGSFSSQGISPNSEKFTKRNLLFSNME